MDTLQTVQSLLIKEFGLAPEQVRADAMLEALGIDSLSTIEFMFLLEEKFNLRMPEAPAAVRTVGDIVREIDNLKAQEGAAALPG